MNKLNIITTQYFDTTGYATVSRFLANSLNRKCEVKLETNMPQGWEGMCTDDELIMFKRPFDTTIPAMAIMLPQGYFSLLTEETSKFIGCFLWEGNKLSDGMKQLLEDERIDTLIVPSQHTKDCIKNSECSILDKVKVIPYGVEHKIFSEDKEIVKHEKFTFLLNKGWPSGINDRGGTQYAIKAYFEEFTKDDPVQMIVKINPSYISPGWDFKTEVTKLGLEINENSPDVKINTEVLTPQQLSIMYNGCHVYVCTQMADSFNLAGLEAMACGLPTIQSDFGGQTEYAKSDNSWLIPGKLKPVTWDLLYEGVSWQEPSVKAIKEAMREAFVNKVVYSSKKEKALLKAKEFSWDRCAQEILAVV